MLTETGVLDNNACLAQWEEESPGGDKTWQN
jgi:hypothetical protein